MVKRCKLQLCVALCMYTTVFFFALTVILQGEIRSKSILRVNIAQYHSLAGEKSDTPPTKRTNSSSPGLHSSRAAGPLTASTISAGRGQVSQLKTILGVVIPVSFFVGIAVGIIMLAWKRRLCTSRVAASSNSSPSSISNDFETHQVTETSLNC